MKNWQKCNNLEEWNKILNRMKEYKIFYTGENQKEFPCELCLRDSTDSKTTIQIRYKKDLK